MNRHRPIAFLALALACLVATPPGAASPVDDIVTLPGDVPLRPDDIVSPRPPCDDVQSATIIQGLHDNFDESNAAEPATPRWDLRSWMSTASSSPRRDYDDHDVNNLFGTTLTGIPANVLGGTLTMHVRPEGDLYYNDGFAVGFDAATQQFAISSSFASWGGKTPSGWTVGQDYLVYVSLTPALVQKINAEGFLDVYVQDDTNVDEIALAVSYCHCDVVYSGSVLQGELDGFNAASQPAPTPGAAFNAWMGGIGGTRNYDQTGVNRRFGTTLANLPAHLLSLTVDVRLRGEGELDYNDGFALQFHAQGPQFSWSDRLTNLVPGWATTGVVSVNVGALNGGTVLADVNAAHALDVYVQDDTNVDWVWINYTYCKCMDARTTTRLGGVQDDFSTANGPEPTTARPPFAAAQTTYPMRTFDSKVIDSQFAYSFTNLPANILGATLEIRMKPAGSLSTTDYIELQWANGAFVWGRGMNALYGGTWSPSSAGPTTFTLDLANLPGATPQDAVLASMNANHYLDVYVADDTDVDYVQLTIQYCACPVYTPQKEDVQATLADVLACTTLSADPSVLALPGACVSTVPGLPDGAPSPGVGVNVSVAAQDGCGGASVAAVALSTPLATAYAEVPDPAGASLAGLLAGGHVYLDANGEPGLQCDGDARVA